MNNFSLFAGALPFLAQTPAPPDLPKTKSILDTLIAAGPVMYVLLAMSIVMVMLVVTYLLTIRRGTAPLSCRNLLLTIDVRPFLSIAADTPARGTAMWDANRIEPPGKKWPNAACCTGHAGRLRCLRT
jgi:hypothetical protein